MLINEVDFIKPNEDISVYLLCHTWCGKVFP